jgi:hypothetical protein
VTDVSESSAQTGNAKHRFVRSAAKRALAPLIASAVTATSAYLARKASALAQEKLLPKLQEKGGGRAVAHEALTAVAEKVPEPASGPIETVAEKIGDEQSSREGERRGREQRRDQRRRALEQSGSS